MPSHLGRAITFTAKGQVEVLERTQEPPGARQVILETLRSAVSPGTDLARLYGPHAVPRSYPVQPGALTCGRVIELGADVQDISIGEIFIAGYGHQSHGAWDADKLLPIPAGVGIDDATLGPLAVVSMQAIRRAQITMGDSVLIFGLGVVGQFAQILARISGGSPVVGVDHHDARLEIARKTGLQHALNPTSPDFADQLSEIVPSARFRVTIDSTGANTVAASLLERTCDEGRVVILGGVHRRVELDLYTHFQKRCLTLIGAGGDGAPLWPHDDTTSNMALILNYIASGQFAVQPLITHVVPVSAAPATYRMLRAEKDRTLGVVFIWSD